MQAEYTGKRLKELNLPYTEIIESTMTRAQETGSIISKCLPEVSIVPSSLTYDFGLNYSFRYQFFIVIC